MTEADLCKSLAALRGGLMKLERQYEADRAKQEGAIEMVERLIEQARQEQPAIVSEPVT